MKFGSGKIGMVTVNRKAYDLTGEPSRQGCNEGLARAGAVDEDGAKFTVFFKDGFFGALTPWNVERAE